MLPVFSLVVDLLPLTVVAFAGCVVSGSHFFVSAFMCWPVGHSVLRNFSCIPECLAIALLPSASTAMQDAHTMYESFMVFPFENEGDSSNKRPI